MHLQQPFPVKVLGEAPSLAGVPELTVSCIPVKWKPARNDNPGFQEATQVPVPLSLLEELLCLLLSCLGVGSCPWLSVHGESSASETPSHPQQERSAPGGETKAAVSVGSFQ